MSRRFVFACVASAALLVRPPRRRPPGADGDRHDPQPVPGRGPVAGDRRAVDRRGDRRRRPVWNELQATKFAERVVRWRRRSRRPRPIWSGCRRSRCGASRRRPTAARRRSARSPARPPATAVEHRLPRAAAQGARLQLQGRRRPGGVRRRASRRRRPQRRDRHRPLAALRRRLRRAADDARRDPRPQGQQGEARRDHGPATTRRATSRTSAGSRSRSTAAGRRSRRARQAQVPLRRHPPRGLRRPEDPRGAGQGADQGPAEDEASR